MSRFITRLKSVSGAAPPSMGFKVTREAVEKPRILLMADILQYNLKKMADGLAAADAAVYRVTDLDSATKFTRATGQALSGVPAGLWLNSVDGLNLAKTADTAGDFIVFPAATPLAALKEEKAGKIIEINTLIEPGLLRAANELPVDAVLISAEQGKAMSLTCESLLFFHLCAGLLEKPLLARVPIDVSLDELKMLWEAGICGVALAIEDEASLKKLTDLCQEIEKATFPSRRRRRKTEVALPPVSGITEVAEEAEEEEEDE